MRYFLVDRITEIEPGKRIRGIKCVTLTDDIVHDHFPLHPILPGALITEGLAQLAGFLLEQHFNSKDDAPVRRAILTQIEKMKFHSISVPGDRLEFTAEILSLLEDAAQVGVEAQCNGEKRASGRLSFYLSHIDSKAITQQRQDLYQVWTRGLKDCPSYR